MQPSDAAKDVPARRNGPFGIKTRLNLDSNHAGPMREKTKASWEHFCNNYLFTANKEKHVTQQRFIGYVTQGKRRGVWAATGAAILQATYESRHSADLT